MANILSDAKKQQVIALGQLGWTLRRIEAATGVRRETAGAYLKAAGVSVRPPGRWGHPPANPAKEVSTDPTTPAASPSAPPAWPPGPQRAPTASACAPYRELIELALARGRNAMAIWRDLVDDHGFPAQYASVRRFVVTLRGARTPEAHPGHRHRARLALAEIVEDGDLHGAAEAAKRLLMQLAPAPRARRDGQQADALAAVAGGEVIERFLPLARAPRPRWQWATSGRMPSSPARASASR